MSDLRFTAKHKEKLTPAEKKVLDFLKVNEHYQHIDPIGDISELLGTRRSTIIKALQKFQKLGYIYQIFSNYKGMQYIFYVKHLSADEKKQRIFG